MNAKDSPGDFLKSRQLWRSHFQLRRPPNGFLSCRKQNLTLVKGSHHDCKAAEYSVWSRRSAEWELFNSTVSRALSRSWRGFAAHNATKLTYHEFSVLGV